MIRRWLRERWLRLLALVYFPLWLGVEEARRRRNRRKWRVERRQRQ